MAYGGPFQPNLPTPRPYQGVGGLINTLHGAMVHEPRAEHVSQYAKMLAALTGLQQKEHAMAGQRPQQGGPPAAPLPGFQSPVPMRGGAVADAGYDTGRGAAEAAAAMAARYPGQQQLNPSLLRLLGFTPQVITPSSLITALHGPSRMGGPVY